MTCERAGGLAIFVALFAGCVQSEFGVQVDLEVENAAPGPLPPGISVSNARIGFSRIALTPCENPHEAVGIRLSALLWGRAAYAHSESTPTTLGTPLVHDLLAPSSARMGALAPPPGEYCDVLVFGSPPDEDAPGLAEAPAMVGRALWITGTGGDDGAAWQITRGGWWSVTQRLDPPLVVRPEAPRAALMIRLDLASALTASMPLTEANPDAVASALLSTMQIVWPGSRDVR